MEQHIMVERYLANAYLLNIEAYQEQIQSGSVGADLDTYGSDKLYNTEMPLPSGWKKEEYVKRKKTMDMTKKKEVTNFVIKTGKDVLDKVHTEVMESISKKSKEYLDADSLQNYEMLQNVKLGVQVLYQRLKSEYEK